MAMVSKFAWGRFALLKGRGISNVCSSSDIFRGNEAVGEVLNGSHNIPSNYPLLELVTSIRDKRVFIIIQRA